MKKIILILLCGINFANAIDCYHEKQTYENRLIIYNNWLQEHGYVPASVQSDFMKAKIQYETCLAAEAAKRYNR
ncbi:hypothetical protein [Helicobacter pullorum]|uniref:hypothetical protein n=1 Tax=Helicobacter pullorum TaxID=35818 RepID=UPI001D94292E|nr:hypothetical protein [Helicobacter pullorum]HJF84035.1 hypothetical protein [Helicobacter pullorum]